MPTQFKVSKRIKGFFYVLDKEGKKVAEPNKSGKLQTKRFKVEYVAQTFADYLNQTIKMV